MTKAGAGTLVGSAGNSAKRSASRAVVYCRVSSHEQLKGLSLETQSKACIDYCRSQGMEVAEVFVERAESASTTDRTQLQRMLTYCRTHRGRIHFLVVYMLDRYVVGGFYRVHAERGIDENLNAPGASFVPLAFAESTQLPKPGVKPGASAPNRFYMYGVIGRLAMLAASYELEATDPDAEIYE